MNKEFLSDKIVKNNKNIVRKDLYNNTYIHKVDRYNNILQCIDTEKIFHKRLNYVEIYYKMQ